MLFVEIPEPCVLCLWGNGDISLELLMFDEHMKPNDATFVSILSSCTFLDVCVALYLGRQLHAHLVRMRI